MLSLKVFASFFLFFHVLEFLKILKHERTITNFEYVFCKKIPYRT